jgi:hypothetical protein
MELTGTPLVVLLVVVAVACFAVIVIGLPRRGRPAVRMVTRGVEVLLLNAVVLGLFGALLNDQYLFYSSWSDLFESGSPKVESHHGGSQNDVVSAHLRGPGLAGVVQPGSLPPLPEPGSRLQTYRVTDPRTGSGGQVLVYLPQGYNPASHRTYPVIEGLHGFPGGPAGFAKLDFFSSADHLTAEHKLAPSIFVVPMIDTPPSLDTECVNGGPGLPQTDTWLSRDIPAWTVQHFRARPGRTSWATLGYSYGAWCAAELSLRHPDVFGGSVVLLGYFRPDFSPYYDPLSPASLRGYDLVRLARTSPPPVAMYVLTSHEDPLSYATSSKFLSEARAPLDVTGVVLAHGGHRLAVLTPYIPGALAWLGATLPGFHA